MSFITLLPALQSQVADPADMVFNLTPTGDTDAGACIRGLNDGKYLDTIGDIFLETCFIDPGTTIFPNKTIKNVKLRLNLLGGGGISPTVFTAGHYYISSVNNELTFEQGEILINAFDSPSSPFVVNGIYDSIIMDTNPITGIAWVRSDLFVPLNTDMNVGESIWILSYNWDLSAPVHLDYFVLIVEYEGLAVDSASPNQAGIYGGASIEIIGSGFSSGTVTNVFFGTTPASDIFVLNDTTLTCTAPAHVKDSVSITVEVTDDQGNVTTATSSTNIFTFEQYTFNIENLTSLKKPGDKVKITTPTAPDSSITNFAQQPGILNGVEQIILSYVNQTTGAVHTITLDSTSYYILVYQPDTLWFYIPIGFGRFSTNLDVTITLVGDGTIFSGSVIAGVITILFEDASGIYKLTPGQTHDTLYFRTGFIVDYYLLFNLFNTDEVYEDDFFSFMNNPYKILAEDNYQDEYVDDDFFLAPILQAPVITRNVEIPSPFIKTAFIP